VSLDTKDASSDPNLKVVHAGASMRKAQHLQPKASDIADAEVGYFAFSRLAAHIRVLSKSGEKPTLPAKRSFRRVVIACGLSLTTTPVVRVLVVVL
jgi:hypothetical protein